ncbi:RAMP superfamily CRISPR-associated protein [Oscillatoria sp. FACHB-1406]|uniref:RAMP superfamily CRISPR-associated protein n=1 Tax=Oscillatoria sp. FACHB-1406 TaxID=2692846 RepID=UPI0016828BB9|nr:RAMP superfamily CRISPR-associated protein [Oscillatoria sp. FACHB-1406]MBD2578558.1 hypothetical protein [Oscillatoria sp. FACHB-1406]
MQYDYYAFRKEQLSEPLDELDRAKVEIDEAKQRKDKNARQQAERKIEQAAEKSVQIEPHLAYLWFWAEKEENDREAKQAKEANNKTEEKKAKEQAKLNSENANCIRDAWRKHLTADKIKEDFHFTPDISALNFLPSLSFMLRVPFKLRKPYLSKDDRAFHLLDNPVRKDKVFQTPMVASTSWKGALRAALWQLDYKENNEQIIRLFGDDREDEKGQAGRLYFYPTFFDKIGLEVINPHDPKKGTSARGPIYIECVPKNATGDFVILYIPFGKTNESEVAKDLELVAKGVEAMLTVYGFGAKTSSGFGVVEVSGKVDFAIRADWSELAETSPPAKQPEFLNDDGNLKQGFLNPDGSFKTEKQYKIFLQSQGTNHNKKLYQDAKKWLEANAKESASESKSLQPMAKMSFVNLSELSDRVKEIAKNLCNGGKEA